MIEGLGDKRTWDEFRDVGLLWWVNRVLHVFGWVLVAQMEHDGTIGKVTPHRCGYGGFTEEIEQRNHRRLREYMDGGCKSEEGRYPRVRGETGSPTEGGS